MNTKSKQVGIRAHNAIGKGLKFIGRGFVKAGKGVKTGAIAAKDFTSGLVIGERNIEEEQLALAKEKAERMQLDPSSKLYQDLTCDDRR